MTKQSPLHILLLLTISPLALAQQAPDQGPPRWSLGIGAAITDSEYAGEGNRVRPFPLLTYEGERFFWRGIGGGVHLLRRDGFTVDATVSGRMDGIDRDDFGVRELAERGVDRALLDDRDDGIDAGLAAQWRGRMGQLDAAVKGDVSGTSKGFEASVKYAYPFQFGGTRVAPYVSVAHLSRKLANYYYGTLPDEVRRGVVDYRPGGATVPRVGVEVMRPFAGRWLFIGNVSYRHLPGKLTDSPLVEKDRNGAVSAFVGVARGF